MRFVKYHALGNDYIVLNPADYPEWPQPDAAVIRTICHRNFGIGSDGILWGPLPSSTADAGLRIFNPDGSEAEKSGNGLRIFSRYLWDNRIIATPDFTVETPGGIVSVSILEEEKLIRVGMGRVSFQSSHIPVTGTDREVINERIETPGATFSFCAATIGNPHCVILQDSVSEAFTRQHGPSLECHPSFPRRINVQFMQIIDRANIRIEIWERGAGYTLASGSSSSAAAAVAHKLGLVDAALTVHMPGGQLSIQIGDDWQIAMTGPVTGIGSGKLSPELLTFADQQKSRA